MKTTLRSQPQPTSHATRAAADRHGAAPLISLHDVTKTYTTGDVAYTALDGVDLSVQPGDSSPSSGPRDPASRRC